MTTEIRKKTNLVADSSNGETKDEELRLVAESETTEPASTDAHVEAVATRIEKRLEEKLAGLEEKLKQRIESGRKSRSEAKGSDKLQSEEDMEESPKEPRRRTAPAPSRVPTRRTKPEKKRLVDMFLSVLPGQRPHDYERLIDMLEHMDEFGKFSDKEIDKSPLEKLVMFLYKTYWRVETTGLQNIPGKGRTLIVANHSGVIPFDGAMIATAVFKIHPAHRVARFMIEDWFGQLPFATAFMNAFGQVRACQENAERLLRQDQLVGVFPEGIKGMAKGFGNRYNLARFGRGGVIRLAIRTHSPVVPTAVVGAEEIYVVLGYANWLGKFFGMPLFPISLTFPWLGPLGLVPLPTKWYINVGEVIRYDEYDESALKDNVIINRLNRQLRSTIQDMVDSLLKKRRSLFLG
ncbi:1-acyl-sn-glycerol-3-phosphate acyltransferase [Candidatus Poribacteria bacterium]|nr:1-acyl-sn-glycerol-3-phosphate acyltransferase [Candidatus Poribacteria bacterium]